MRLIDKKFHDNKRAYFVQCALAALAIVIILAVLDIKKNTAIIASLGATAFIAFGMPNVKSSDGRRMLGGYAVGLIVGCVFSLIAEELYTGKFLWIHDFSYVVFGAFAVGSAILIMAITNTEHPPASGISLGMVLNDWNYRTVIIIVLAIIIMTIVKKLLKPHMMDLV